jgi:hypothetical protein
MDSTKKTFNWDHPRALLFFLFIYLLEIDGFTFKELFLASAKDLFKGHSMEPEN